MLCRPLPLQRCAEAIRATPPALAAVAELGAMRRAALANAFALAFLLGGTATAQANPYVVSLRGGTDVDGVVRSAHLPAPKLGTRPR